LKKVLLIVLVVLLIDQIVKIWIKTSLNYGEHINGGFIDLYFVENEGMAFGMSWGGVTGKLILSIFRILAVAAIGYFIYTQTKKPDVHKGFIFSMSLIFAGAAGNIIDSAFYGFLFDKGTVFNGSYWEHYSGVAQLNIEGYAGFLQGTVVDMFQFDMTWPEWMPWVGGNQVFDAIWNFADFCISIGVLVIIVRQKTFLKKKEVQTETEPA
jgi:signal peptidase II